MPHPQSRQARRPSSCEQRKNHIDAASGPRLQETGLIFAPSRANWERRHGGWDAPPSDPARLLAVARRRQRVKSHAIPSQRIQNRQSGNLRAVRAIRVPAVGSLPNEVDVLIVGCGPAGLTLAAQLAAFPDIKTQIVEQKSGPLLLGQADGIACRTMEMFEAFGFSERVMKEAYWVNETTFWKPDERRANIVRTAGYRMSKTGSRSSRTSS